MRRIASTPRADIVQVADELGFPLLECDGKPYWDETAYYSFSLRQIEDDLEDPTAELHALILETVAHVVSDEATLRRLGFPAHSWNWIADSWRRRDLSLYGRMDLVYDGQTPAKLLEYNADTPTALYEASVFQWRWMNDLKASGALEASADQFNSIHEKLLDWFGACGDRRDLHLAGYLDNMEDGLCIDYIAYCAGEAGLQTQRLSWRISASCPTGSGGRPFYRSLGPQDRAPVQAIPVGMDAGRPLRQDSAISRLTCYEPLGSRSSPTRAFWRSCGRASRGIPTCCRPISRTIQPPQPCRAVMRASRCSRARAPMSPCFAMACCWKRRRAATERKATSSSNCIFCRISTAIFRSSAAGSSAISLPESASARMTRGSPATPHASSLIFCRLKIELSVARYLGIWNHCFC